MAEQIRLLELQQRPWDESGSAAPVPFEQLQLRLPERRQRVFTEVDVELLVGRDHRVRAIWELSGKFDLSAFAANLQTRRGQPGRPAWAPRLLVAIWIWAYSEGVTSARAIERQCRYRHELLWLCGLEEINHHTLSDFRVNHAEALDILFTKVLALLQQEGWIDLAQVAVDGTRVRSQASSSSERRRPTIERHLKEARAVVERLSSQADDEDANRRRQAARERAAIDRVERMEQALVELEKAEAVKRTEQEKQHLRVSENEPEARRQRESNGGFGLGYNAQFATDAKEKIVVGVELTNNASDAKQLKPTLADVGRRLKQSPDQALADAGYNSRPNIAAMEADGIEYATPAPARDKGSQAAARAAGIQAGFESKFFIYDETTDTFRCPADKTLKYRGSSRKRGRKYRQYQGKESDCLQCEQRLKCCPRSGRRRVSRAEEDELMARHRRWMETERARAAYRLRAETAEFPNAWLKERFGVRKFRVRGLRKARTELLWAMLAYNVRAWERLVWRAAPGDGFAAAQAA